MSKNGTFFRFWYYFRTGWSTYFSFILAAINTLTVTYFLAVDNYPFLKIIFPSFEQYVGIIVIIGIPLLVTIGYFHFKRTKAFKSEVDVLIESNPYQKRNTVNSELNLRLNLKIITMLYKISKNESMTKSEMEEVEKLFDEVSKLSDERNFSNNLDLDYIKNILRKTDK